MTADTREVIAKIVDPIAMMTFEEEVERLHRELSKAIPSLTKDDPSLLGLARDNIAESFDDRNAALAKADAILALSAPTPAVTEEQVEAMARAHYEPFGQSWDALVRAAPEYAEKLRSAMRAALAASPALPETKSPDQGEGS